MEVDEVGTGRRNEDDPLGPQEDRKLLTFDPGAPDDFKEPYRDIRCRRRLRVTAG